MLLFIFLNYFITDDHHDSKEKKKEKKPEELEIIEDQHIDNI